MAGRYQVATGAENEYEPGSNDQVLRNLRGITSPDVMDRTESEALEIVQTNYYRDGAITQSTRITAMLIKKMHKDWLNGIYSWAGEYRTVELTLPDFQFPPAYLIEKNMAEFETACLNEYTPCRPDEVEKVCLNVAIVHADLLLIHPFRDGNGRVARWLSDLMFAQAGFNVPKYGFVDAEGNVGDKERQTHQRYVDAVRRGYVRDYDLLAGFFAEALTRGAA